MQTLESMMQDQVIIDTMKTAMTAGKSASDLLGFAGVVGNVESGLQCVGSNTASQYATVTASFRSTSAFSTARLAGWEPEANEWGFERVANCLGAIPLAGSVIKGAKTAEALAGKAVIASLPSVEETIKVFEAFNTPFTFTKYAAGVKGAEALVPGNPKAASFVKGSYDFLMSGMSLEQGLQAGVFFLTSAR